MPISTVYKVIKARLRLHAYKLQIVQVLEQEDRPRKMAIATDLLRRIEDDAEFLYPIMFFNEACFHLSDIVNRHYLCKWGSENSNEYRELQRDYPKKCWKISYFHNSKSFSHVCLQQYGAPPHRGTIVRNCLKDLFTGRLIGGGDPIPWHPNHLT
ncbi:uncharacterized protein NPIL_119611 [Nephila pilipes]|uniref:Uncharacterized protein n=1 Tax=Nephila pilipes TaxID=299642 RepID=A0A8X6TT04_NEPPI|nr:uncharacterized protein NPIL_119611 [Nephila pilipes]